MNWLDPGAFGTLGVGGGFALGAKLCRPDSEIWVVYGDGSLGYSVAEFDTFTRHKVEEIRIFLYDDIYVLFLLVACYCFDWKRCRLDADCERASSHI